MSFNQPFQEQLDFFRQKLNLPTEAWDDITLAAHDRAFIVAGAQGADLLEDLRGAVDEAIQQGTGLEAFRTNFARIVAERGWTGWTGEGTAAGRAWRAKVIYDTNMSTSYAAGRFKQLSDPAMLKILPYWQYHHVDGQLHPRPLHESWDGLTLPPDHPFWATHFPPNGWYCHCWVSAVSKDDFMVAIANGKGPANVPEGTEGIDKGFAYAPGASLMPADDEELKQAMLDKLLALPTEIAQQLAADIAPLLQYSIENIVQLVSAGVLAVDAAKKLARLLPGFTAADLGKIDAAQPAKGDVSFAGFNPDQPRVDAGSPDGGEWTAEGGGTPTVQDGHHTLEWPRMILHETDKAVAVEDSTLMVARKTAGYDIKELSSSQIQRLTEGGSGKIWLPKSQISINDGHVVGMAPWLAKKQGFGTKEGLAVQAKAFDAGKARYETLLAQAKAGGVKGVRVGMRTTTIKEKMRAHGMAVEFADDDEGLDFMARSFLQITLDRFTQWVNN